MLEKKDSIRNRPQRVSDYLLKQEEPHRKQKFKDEYFQLLKDYEIQFKEE